MTPAPEAESGLWSGADRRWLAGLALIGAALRLAICGILVWAGGLQSLAAASGLGAACYLGAAGLARMGRTGPALGAVMAVEILLQATLAVLWLGWDVGFEYHILLLLPVLLFTAWPPRPLNWLAAGAVGTTYLVLDLGLRLRPAPELLTEPLQLVLHVLNAAAALLVLGLIAARQQRLVGRATRGASVPRGARAVSGVLNRRRIAELAGQHLRRIGDADGARPGLCLLVGDIDQLAQTAVRHGPIAADQVEGAVGAALLQGMRQGDLVGRWGDKGFLIVLPGSDAGAGRMVGERLLALVRALEIRAGADGELLSPSISLGLCAVAAGEGLEQATARAERALRLVQAAGRSHIGLATPDN